MMRHQGLGGAFPAHNGAAADTARRALELGKESVRDAFLPWHGVEHRLESVAEKDGVTYVNDSLATNVNAAWMALETMHTPVVWLAGGHAIPGYSGAGMEQLCDLVQQKVKAIYYLDKAVPAWFRSLFLPVPVLPTRNMREAVVSAQVMAEPGDTVLLSPASASFNWYGNLVERGRSFKKEVGRL